MKSVHNWHFFSFARPHRALSESGELCIRGGSAGLPKLTGTCGVPPRERDGGGGGGGGGGDLCQGIQEIPELLSGELVESNFDVFLGPLEKDPTG